MELEIKQRKQSCEDHSHQNFLLKKCPLPQELPPKQFIMRDSRLTNMWENTHLRPVYNFCTAIVAVLYLNIILFYCFNIKKLKEDLSVVSFGIGQFHIVIALWFGMNTSIVFILYPVFRVWATTRSLIGQKRIYDTISCLLYVMYQLTLLVIPGVVVIYYNLPPISSFIVIMEQVRLVMKTHAFVRENAPRALRYKVHQDGDTHSLACPEVEKLIYFLFAPTLVYRDNYPRTQYVRWSYVAWNFLQIIGCIIVGYIPFTFIMVHNLHQIGIKPIPVVEFMGTLLLSVFAGITIKLLDFYGLFHCWLNAFAEMLRFGDRMFYDDWWNSTSFSYYYRTWSMLVQDWVYSYIYRDMYMILGRTGAMLFVFIFSAVIHEYIMAISFKFLLPLIFINFSTFGIILVFITRRKKSNFWNVFIWCCLVQGWAHDSVFYSLEWYARINCPRMVDSWLDYVIPRSLTCDIISV